jgi:hypothetical protein
MNVSQSIQPDDDFESWDVEDEPDFDKDELGIDPEEEESDIERDRRYLSGL